MNKSINRGFRSEEARLERVRERVGFRFEAVDPPVA